LPLKEEKLKKKLKPKKLKELEKKKKKKFRWNNGDLREKNKLNKPKLSNRSKDKSMKDNLKLKKHEYDVTLMYILESRQNLN
jgi:hypothetical protein